MIFPRSRLTRAAFSMIEVMIAITVLAVAITAILGNYQTLDSARQDTASRGQVAEIARCILDRIVAADTRALGEDNPLQGVVPQPWSLPRIEDEPALRLPLSLDAADPADNLVAQGLVSSALPIPNLQVWIEYYRGLEVVDPVTNDVLAAGVMTEDFDSRGEFREAFANQVWRTNRRLATNQAPYLQVGEDDPIVVRVIMTWGAAQRLEFYTTKRRPPGA